MIDKANQFKTVVLGMLCLAVIGCATTPQVDPEAELQTQEISMYKAEMETLEQEKQALLEEKSRYSSELQLREAELNQLKNHTDAQKEAIGKRDETINVLSVKIQQQEKMIESKESAIGELKKKQEEVKVVAKTETKAVESTPKGKYHLRIISLPGRDRYEQEVKKIEEHLKKNNISEVTVRKSGSYWVVDIGNFQSYKDSEAVSLQNKMKSYQYEGVPQFRDCLYVKY